jgi:2-aminoadipate transaminase
MIKIIITLKLDNNVAFGVKSRNCPLHKSPLFRTICLLRIGKMDKQDGHQRLMLQQRKIMFSQRSQRMQPSAIRKMTKLASSAGADLISFAGGMPNPDTFPLQQLAEFAASEIRDHRGKSLQYGLTQGHRGLIDWITGYAHKKKMIATPENVICTTGSQQALDLITETFIEPGDSIFVETPTYIGAIAVFRKAGAHMIPVKQDDQGIVPEDLKDKLKAAPPDKRKLIYLISNFQNPSGISISGKRRRVIAELLEEYNVYLIEDDPYGEIYFDELNRPADPIKTECPKRVLYLGTFSKLVAPTFRTGWVIAEQDIIQKLELAKEAADLCCSMLDQRIVYRFCSSSSFDQHLSHLRSFYRERWNAMDQALQQQMPQRISWTHPSGGFFIWMTLPEGHDAESFLEESISNFKVSYVIGRPFTCDDSGQNYLRLAFSSENPDRIHEGINRLAKLLKRT